MVQRAAGWPGAAATPQPPSQFHWPAQVGARAMRPSLRSADSDASSRSDRRSVGVAPRSDSSAESSASAPDRAAITPSSQPRADSPMPIATHASKLVPAVGEGPETRGMFDTGHEITLAGAPTPVSVEPHSATRPVVDSMPEPFHGEETAATVPRPVSDFNRPQSSPATSPISEVVDFQKQAQAVRPALIERAVLDKDEATDEARPAVVHTVLPARLTPVAQQAPLHSMRGQSRPQEPPPPVEVKIGSVEIVFDQPAVQAAQPAPVRPAGFAEFADLRRYAARLWSSRSR